MIVLLDNGHGIDTPGKRSPKWPDGSQLFEYEFNRNIVSRVASGLAALDIPYYILVPELNDISLAERCKRANRYSDALLISIHGNAGGGTGWECFTTKGKTKADEFATLICHMAKREFPEQKMRFDYTDNDPDKEEDFYILKNTKCPAILTENFFMDNKADCNLMLSEQGRERIASLHIEAINYYLL